MADFINKVVTIVIIFVGIVLMPLIIYYSFNHNGNKRQVFNELTLFVDKIKDKGTLTESDLDEFSLSVNSYGMVVDVHVERIMKVATARPDGTISTTYVVLDVEEGSDVLYTFNSRDILKVTVEEITINTARKLIYQVLKVDEGNFKISQSAMIR